MNNHGLGIDSNDKIEGISGLEQNPNSGNGGGYGGLTTSQFSNYGYSNSGNSATEESNGASGPQQSQNQTSSQSNQNSVVPFYYFSFGQPIQCNQYADNWKNLGASVCSILAVVNDSNYFQSTICENGTTDRIPANEVNRTDFNSDVIILKNQIFVHPVNDPVRPEDIRHPLVYCQRKGRDLATKLDVGFDVLVSYDGIDKSHVQMTFNVGKKEDNGNLMKSSAFVSEISISVLNNMYNFEDIKTRTRLIVEKNGTPKTAGTIQVMIDGVDMSGEMDCWF